MTSQRAIENGVVGGEEEGYCCWEKTVPRCAVSVCLNSMFVYLCQQLAHWVFALQRLGSETCDPYTLCVCACVCELFSPAAWMVCRWKRASRP